MYSRAPQQLLYHKKMLCIFSWRSRCTAVPQEINTKFSVTPRFSLYLALLTCVVLVPLEDRSKQAMNDDRCDNCAQHEHDDSCCFHPLENSLAIGRRSGAVPRSRRRHRRRGRTTFSAVCHVLANIQATSAAECGSWYGVRRPYVALVRRCYTDLEIAKKV